MLVAIDGPAGAGKSTVARRVADAQGFTYLATGAMYRAAALAWPRDPATLEIAFTGGLVLLDGEDVSEAIRSAEVSERASRVSAEPRVREALVARQRELIAGGDWVAEGRDIGTVVAPDAELKVWLTADPLERARRRAAQTGGDPDDELAAQSERDERDATRDHSPMRAAADAVELDTTGFTIEEVVGRIVALVRALRTG